jgi:hypothetical protein
MVSTEIRPFIAAYYIIYGITKLIIALSLFYIPASVLSKIPILNKFVMDLEDKTLAGHFYEYILMIFGIYTIIMGISLLHILPYGMRVIIENKIFEYSVFIILGLALVIFYSLVVFTNLPISKSNDERNIFYYKLLGIGGGISFLIMPIIFEIIEYFFPVFDKLPFEHKAMYILIITLIFFVILGFIWTLFIKKHLSIKYTKQGVRIAKDGYAPF